MDDGAEVPPFFLCPISLQVMEDPVTLSTGVTYDRRSIELWLSSYGHTNCPVTNQPLLDASLTPNTTLLNLIGSWKHSVAASASDRKQPPRPRIDHEALHAIASELGVPNPQARTLERIAGLVRANEEYRACMEERGITGMVAGIAARPRSPADGTWAAPPATLLDDATSLLHLLGPTPRALGEMAERDNLGLLAALSATMQTGSQRARVHAALLLDAALRAADEGLWARSPPAGMLEGAVEMLKDQNSERAATMAALSVLAQVVASRRNRTRAVEAGAVAVLVELLAEDEAGRDRRRCEAMLALVATLCGCAEGRAALREHPAGIAAVAGKLLKVSRAATERAAKALLLACRWGGPRVAEEMLEVGGVARLLTVVQVEPQGKARDMAMEILSSHLARWNKSPCFSLTTLPF